uniref:Monocyte to macrophage differentiation associated 2 n=1 Tax=Pipistrellus kuhlii TaxID=59472 RepID=A0A7J7XBI3_PIPKU|nr:monocyte to macrophage differentiation associated 2 [Pipistrellus kuhlii]
MPRRLLGLQGSGLARLNLRELGPWAAHMRWPVWVMASVGTVYVFFFRERYKLLELLCYVIMGFFPAVVILSMMVSPPRGSAI